MVVYVIQISYKSSSCNMHVRCLQTTKKNDFCFSPFTDKYSLRIVQCLTITGTVKSITEIRGTVKFCGIYQNRKKQTNTLMLKDHKSAIHLEGVTFDKVVRYLNGKVQFMNILLFNNCQLEIMRFIHSSDNMFLFSNHNVQHRHVSKQ